MPLPKKAVIVFFLFPLLFFLQETKAQMTKVAVTVAEASIRTSPDLASDIIRRPSSGEVFDVIQKMGEWYEIKLTSEIGVEITPLLQKIE